MELNTDNLQSGTRDALAAGYAMAEPRLAEIGANNEIPFVVVPEGYRAEALEHLCERPAHKRAKVELRDAASFIAYFKLHQIGSTIWGTIEPPRFVAVFDDHRKDEPGWRQHTATYSCPLSPEWRTWIQTSGKGRKQAEFAQFIEDNLPDIIEPEAAHMLEVSRSLEAKKKVNFASGIRLSNGEVQFTYNEEIQGTTQKGQLNVPEEFVIAIPVFENGPRYRITCRLRYRISEGEGLVMWHEVVRPHKVLEDAVMEVWQEIAGQTGVTIFHGNPNL